MRTTLRFRLSLAALAGVTVCLAGCGASGPGMVSSGNWEYTPVETISSSEYTGSLSARQQDLAIQRARAARGESPATTSTMRSTSASQASRSTSDAYVAVSDIEATQQFTYTYYPNAEVYFSANQNRYFWQDRTGWRSGATLPGHIKLDSANRVRVPLGTSEPHRVHASVQSAYPPRSVRFHASESGN